MSNPTWELTEETNTIERRYTLTDAPVMTKRFDGARFQPTKAVVQFEDGQFSLLTVYGQRINKDGSTNRSHPKASEYWLGRHLDTQVPEWLRPLAVLDQSTVEVTP